MSLKPQLLRQIERLKPHPARWFELLVARDDLAPALETLAETGAVELEIHGETAAQLAMPALQERLDEYQRLAQRYQPYWPQDNLRSSSTPGEAAESLNRALEQLRAWGEQAEPHIRRLEVLEAERRDLELLEEFLAAAGSRLDMGRLARAGLALAGRVYVLPVETRIGQIPAGVISHELTTPHHRFLVAVGPPERMTELTQDLAALKGRALPLPEWLTGKAPQSLGQVRERCGRIDQELAQLKTRLTELTERHRLHEALGDITRLEWFVSQAQGLPVSENFAWITGWTSDLEGERLDTTLTSAGVRGVLRFTPPPAGKIAPILLRNPPWARPFELFARLLGTPGRDEADPSRLLMIIVPLLFGYMFGDVGQGLVLFMLGLVLQQRWPELRILVACGLSAMVFGLLFGSVFSREDVLPALWLHPLEQPLTILVVPLVGGVMLLLLGLLLNAVEAYWRGRLRSWQRVDAALLLMYLSLISALLAPSMLLVTAAALLWYLSGSVAEQQGKQSPLMALLAALGQLTEHLLQLVVNTVSFARVGAFALAHAGLSQTTVALADAIPHTLVALFIFLLGNAIIIALEGLVVSIQTTRLILFEFFIRFLRGEGRAFRPLPARLPLYQTRRIS